MQNIKIITMLMIFLMLFGCSQHQDHDKLTTTVNPSASKNIISSAVEKNTTTVANTSMRSEILHIDDKPKTTNAIEPTTQEHLPSDTSGDTLSYIKKDNMFYIDDKNFAKNQNNCYGIPLPNYFLNRGVSLEGFAVNFTYDSKKWMIASSKGVYGYKLVGGEIAIMTAPEETSGGTFYVPSENDWLKIQTECFDSQQNTMFSTDYANHWWSNGYIQSELQNPNEITVRNKITFKNEKMANIFVLELHKWGLKAVQSKQNLTQNHYYVNGKDVIYQF